MKTFLSIAAMIIIAGCTHGHASYMDWHKHPVCDKSSHHDHSDQHGGTYWHTHCEDLHG